MIAQIVFAKESQEELKAYLSDMNRIIINVEEAMRNLSMKILPAKDAAEQISASIEKFEILKPPSIFSKDHNSMLSAFKSIRDGLRLLSGGEREESVALVKEGAAFLKNAAINMKTIAEREGLIPARPSEPTKPILPPQTPGPIAGISPTPSPHIASPDIQSDFITQQTKTSAGIDLGDIPDTASIPRVPSSSTAPLQKTDLSAMLAAVGKIISIDAHGDYFIVGLGDDFGNKLEFGLKPERCGIMIDNKIVSINEIDKGMDSYILYSQSGDRNEAKFITILKPEDVVSFKKSIESSTVTPANLKTPTE